MHSAAGAPCQEIGEKYFKQPVFQNETPIPKMLGYCVKTKYKRSQCCASQSYVLVTLQYLFFYSLSLQCMVTKQTSLKLQHFVGAAQTFSKLRIATITSLIQMTSLQLNSCNENLVSGPSEGSAGNNLITKQAIKFRHID